MKRIIFTFAIVAMIVSACGDLKDSTQTFYYNECNLIVDTEDESQTAQASTAVYQVLNNLSKGVADVTCSDIIINNQRYSLQTDTMVIHEKTFKVSNVDDAGYAANYWFAKSGNVSAGSSASNLMGEIVWCLKSNNANLISPNYQLEVAQRLNVNYNINGHYRVQSFSRDAFYVGNSIASSGSSSFSSKKIDYRAILDLEKKVGVVYVYNPEFSDSQDNSFPKVIRIEDIPMVFSSVGFTLDAAAPKTTVLGIKNNIITMIDSVDFKATDFRLDFASPDMTEVSISYKINGKNIFFSGSSILK